MRTVAASLFGHSRCVVYPLYATERRCVPEVPSMTLDAACPVAGEEAFAAHGGGCDHELSRLNGRTSGRINKDNFGGTSILDTAGGRARR